MICNLNRRLYTVSISCLIFFLILQFQLKITNKIEAWLIGLKRNRSNCFIFKILKKTTQYLSLHSNIYFLVQKSKFSAKLLTEPKCQNVSFVTFIWQQKRSKVIIHWVCVILMHCYLILMIWACHRSWFWSVKANLWASIIVRRLYVRCLCISDQLTIIFEPNFLVNLKKMNFYQQLLVLYDDVMSYMCDKIVTGRCL